MTYRLVLGLRRPKLVPVSVMDTGARARGLVGPEAGLILVIEGEA
jgi:hypothetical protein